MTIPQHTPSPVPAFGAPRKSSPATVDAINSDTVVRTDPYAETQTKTAYKVRRSHNTDTATLHPFCELWAFGDCIARFLPEKPENIGFMETIQKSMARPWNSLGNGGEIELHPAIRVTFPRRLGENADKPVNMKQDVFKDDIERDSDRRQRALWTCRCLAETKHVAAYTDITSKYITGETEMDLDGALAAINARAKEPGATIVHPNIEAATEISKEYQKTMTRNAGSGELDKALDRKADGSTSPLDDVADINEVLAMVGADPLIVEHKVLDDKPKPHWSADSSWRKAVKDERMKYRASAALTSDEFSDWLHKIFDVKSLKELTMTPETALDIIADTLKKEFAPKPAAPGFVGSQPPSATVPNADPTNMSATTSTDAPNAVAGATVAETPKDATAGKVEPQTAPSTAYPNYPESPITVYPANNGSVIWKGVRFNVSYRLGGNWTMATVLMDDFAAHREFIDPSCIVNAPPLQNAQTGGATAPVLPMTNAAPPVPAALPGAAPDTKGRVPGQTGTDQIAYVQRSVVNDKETIELWSANGKFSEHRLRRDNEKAMLTSVGINVAALAAGTKYPCKLAASWVVTANKSDKGTYYRDVTAIAQVAA